MIRLYFALITNKSVFRLVVAGPAIPAGLLLWFNSMHNTMERKKKLTVDYVLEQFNPYHNDRDEDSASTLIQHKREVFSDLLIHAMNPESEDMREWNDARWRALVSFAEDFNNFLRCLEMYYRQERNVHLKTPRQKNKFRNGGPVIE